MSQWEAEPDEERFDAAGLSCLVYRHTSMGHLCGYVGLPCGHPDFGKDCDAIEFSDDWWPHGGLTSAAKGEWHGMPDRWVCGFDCAHAGDLVPGMLRHGLCADEQYRDWGYVKADTENLAQYFARKIQ